MPKHQAHIIYSGDVQGVGFRWTVQEIANSFGIFGWVKNSPDGTVEALFEGEEGDIKLLMEEVSKTMNRYIHAVRVDWNKPEGKLNSFDIRFV